MSNESKPKVYQPWEVADQVQRFCGPDFPLVSFYEYQALEVKLADAIDALKKIAIKEPMKVNRNEAADMACEFSMVARQTLKLLEE